MAIRLPVSGIERGRQEARRQLLPDILLTLGTGGILPISRGAAMRAVAKVPGKAARLGYERGIRRVPKQALSWVEDIEIKPPHERLRGQVPRGTRKIELYPRVGEPMRETERVFQEELAHVVQAEASRRGKQWVKRAAQQHKAFGAELPRPYGYAASPLEFGAKGVSKEIMASELPYIGSKTYKDILMRNMELALRRGKKTERVLRGSPGKSAQDRISRLIEEGVF